MNTQFEDIVSSCNQPHLCFNNGTYEIIAIFQQQTNANIYDVVKNLLLDAYLDQQEEICSI